MLSPAELLQKYGGHLRFECHHRWVPNENATNGTGQWVPFTPEVECPCGFTQAVQQLLNPEKLVNLFPLYDRKMPEHGGFGDGYQSVLHRGTDIPVPVGHLEQTGLPEPTKD